MDESLGFSRWPRCKPNRVNADKKTTSKRVFSCMRRSRPIMKGLDAKMLISALDTFTHNEVWKPTISHTVSHAHTVQKQHTSLQ